MKNWLSTEPCSSGNIAKNPIGQKDDNRHGGEETEGKGRNQAAVSYNISNLTTAPVIDCFSQTHISYIVKFKRPIFTTTWRET